MPQTPIAPDSAEDLHKLVGDDSTATFEADPKFIDANPTANASTENVDVQAADDEEDEMDDVDEDEEFDDEDDEDDDEDDVDEEDEDEDDEDDIDTDQVAERVA